MGFVDMDVMFSGGCVRSWKSECLQPQNRVLRRPQEGRRRATQDLLSIYQYTLVQTQYSLFLII